VTLDKSAETQLTEGKWPAEETDGWEMTSVSARLLESSAAYRSPSATGALFLLLNDFKRTDPSTMRVAHD
jgi:hypothetical protein